MIHQYQSSLLFTRTWLFDWKQLCCTILLACCGLLFIFSATYTPEQPYSTFFIKQCMGIASGIIIYIIFASIDYRTLMRWGHFGYFLLLGLLFITLIKGHVGMGAKRWIGYSLLRIQPSELAKLLFPALIAYHVHFHAHLTNKYRALMPLLFYLVMSCLLIRQQPDLGTAVLIGLVGLILLWLAGMPRTFFVSMLIGGLLCAPITWHFLKPYQQKRIKVFLGYGDSHQDRYQIEQSMIAIGSGNLSGKGWRQGTQTAFQFLPESRTDFIFAVLCEECGFLGALFLLCLYALLFMYLLYRIMYVPDFAAQLLALGLCLHIIIACIINIGMVTGLLPIVGIPLPFMSYGISNLWVNFASMGWISSITTHPFMNREIYP